MSQPPGSGGPGLGLGCVNLGRLGRSGTNLVHQALDLGVRFFDTADAYGSGQSETVLGRALTGRRQEAVLATKGGYLFEERSAAAARARRVARPVLTAARGWPGMARGAAGHGTATAYQAQDFSPGYLRRAVEDSLRRLRTDHVDLYQLHGPGAVRDDVVALMADLRSEGKIRGFGLGLERLGPADGWLASGAVSSVQLPFGVLDPEAGADLIPRVHHQGISVVARGVLAGGFVGRPHGGPLTDLRPGQPEQLRELAGLAARYSVTPAELALWYVLARPDVATVLVGTSSGSHLADAVRAAHQTPPAGVLEAVRALAARTPDRDGARAG